MTDYNDRNLSFREINSFSYILYKIGCFFLQKFRKTALKSTEFHLISNLSKPHRTNIPVGERIKLCINIVIPAFLFIYAGIKEGFDAAAFHARNFIYITHLQITLASTSLRTHPIFGGLKENVYAVLFLEKD